jgi:holo-[acyl-carrier protein] synthase
MILGVGVDLCQVERIRRSLKGLGDDWTNELFTVEERKLCQLGADHALLFARAFCGKEACFKALGTGRTADVGWHDIEVLQSGPSASLRLSGGALQELQGITPAGYAPVLHVTCSGGAGLAQAVVTISGVPQR